MTKLFLAAGLLASLSVFALAQEDHSAHGGGAMTGGASSEYMQAMRNMDTAMQAMQMTGDPGVDFSAMMIPHHQAAIEMAQSYLKSGHGDPELTALANEIVAAQEREIAQLRAWLASKQ